MVLPRSPDPQIAGCMNKVSPVLRIELGSVKSTDRTVPLLLPEHPMAISPLPILHCCELVFEVQRMSHTTLTNGAAPNIPVIAPVLVINRIAAGEAVAGAMRCIGLCILDEFMTVASRWGMVGRTENPLVST